MIVFYRLGIGLYHLAIRLAALWNAKARQWVQGRAGLLEAIEAALTPGVERVWFHCASLGEFEQGRPLMEAYKREFPRTEIVLTFYSPSGYEVRKNYEGADHVFYLPADGATNAQRFLKAVQPKATFFVKYEFWYFYLHTLQKQGIPTFLVSAIFRDSQLFFKPIVGGWMRKMLAGFSWMFLQDEASRQLLDTFELSKASVAGDTRFDRVYEIVRAAQPIPKVATFKGDATLLVAGSTWPRDEELLAPVVLAAPASIKAVIAPHEIGAGHIQLLQQRFGDAAVLFSTATDEELEKASVLIVDAIGLLSGMYQYGAMAYVGGGFGAGIHNVPEAAAWGIPVVFGPRHERFREAVELAREGAAFAVGSMEEGRNALEALMADPEQCARAGTRARTYVEQQVGATNHILDRVRTAMASNSATGTP